MREREEGKYFSTDGLQLPRSVGVLFVNSLRRSTGGNGMESCVFQHPRAEPFSLNRINLFAPSYVTLTIGANEIL